MVTKRTPIKRQGRYRITPRTVEIFKRMEAENAKCTCAPMEWDAHGKQIERIWCRACEAHQEAFEELLAEFDHLGLPPWERRSIFQHPDDSCPYAPGSFQAGEWKREREQKPEMFELYHELKAAAMPETLPERGRS